MLNTDTATPYLLAQKLIDKSAIIDGELKITNAARRNRNLLVGNNAAEAIYSSNRMT